MENTDPLFLSKWQFRKLVRFRAQLSRKWDDRSSMPDRPMDASSSLHLSVVQQVKSLGSPAGHLHNWRSHADALTKDFGTQTLASEDVEAASHEQDAAEPEHSSCVAGWVDELDLLPATPMQRQTRALDPAVDLCHAPAHLAVEVNAVATQTGGDAPGADASSIALDLEAAATQTGHDGFVFDYGAAVKATVAIAVCGCSASMTGGSSELALLVVPAGEVGLVEQVFDEKKMVKVDFPGIGTAFLTYWRASCST